MKLLKSYRIFFLSIAMAFFLWFYVRLSSTYRQEIDIPLKVINVKNGYALTSPEPPAVRVLFDADGRTLLGIRFFYDVYFVWDMKSTQDSAVVIPSLHPENVVVPDQHHMKIISVVGPDTIRLVTERLVQKNLAIVPNLEAACAAGFVMVGGYRVTPDSVSVMVPASVADSFSAIRTPLHKASGLHEDLDVVLKIDPLDYKPLRFEPLTTVVHVDVQPLGETVFENLPIRLINVPPDKKVLVQPSTFSLRVRGGVDFLASVSRDSIVGIIDYERESQYQFPQPRLTIHAPADLQWSQITPSRFNIVKVDEE